MHRDQTTPQFLKIICHRNTIINSYLVKGSDYLTEYSFTLRRFFFCGGFINGPAKYKHTNEKHAARIENTHPQYDKSYGN